MRKHKSMFMLFSRSSVYPVLGLLSLMCVVQVGLFCLAINSGEYSTLEMIIEESNIHLACYVAFWILFGMMTGYACSASGGMEYTLNRLRISRWGIVGWSSLCNTLWFLAFWMVEALLVLALSRYYLDVREVESGQALFLACYRSEFLHSLVPLREWSRWGRNLAMMVGFGVTTGCCVGKIRRGGILVAVVGAAVGASFFPDAPCSGGGDALLIVCALGTALVSLILVQEGKEETEDEETTV